jgi:hypothetical protein
MSAEQSTCAVQFPCGVQISSQALPLHFVAPGVQAVGNGTQEPLEHDEVELHCITADQYPLAEQTS